jgi:hypothetical protein
MRGKVSFAMVVLALASACSNVDVKSILPIQGPESPATADFDVLSCTAERGRAIARVRFTVDRSVSSIEFRGEYTAADGTVIGQGTAGATDVVPDRTYQVVILHDLSGSGIGGTCHVALGTIEP